MIDFHNHIIPQIDDGSNSIQMSLEMLEEAFQQGIKEVVSTVHYQHPKVEGTKISYDIVQKKMKKLQNELDKNNIPIKIHIGSEVFYLPNLMQIKDDPICTIGNGKFMLIEFQPHHIPENHKQIFFELKMHGITPIIAHPERYKQVQKDISLVYYWLNAGCLIQIDAGSLLGNFGKSSYNTAERIIKNNWCQILGSDAHNNKGRNFILKDSYILAKTWIGDHAKKLVYDNPKSVLNGNQIHIDLEEDYTKIKIPFWKRIN